MRCIDEQYLKTPFYGWPRMTAQLQRLGYEVNHKRVQRLMQVMGLQALYPKRRTSVVDPEHRKYPYLLRNLEIVRCDQVWSTDITYVPMAQGFMYLVAECYVPPKRCNRLGKAKLSKEGSAWA
jgi:putative transposase